MDATQPRRLYQVWKGSNRFFCGGKLIFGPDVASLLISALLIAGPSVAFCSQVISKISTSGKNGSWRDRDQAHILGFPALIVAIAITVLNCTIHGVGERDNPSCTASRTKELTVNGFSVKVKFCDTCLLYRPPRASHCSICNNCVQRFDHHCPWVGQCIGLRNYRFFYLFISSSTFLCIYVFTFSWLNIIGRKGHYGSIWKLMWGEILSLFLITYTFIAVWFVGGLTIFHTYLICTNQTTYENFRYRYETKVNPYDKGIFRNFKSLFFSRIPPSMNNFRSWVPTESAEAVPLTPKVGTDITSHIEKIDMEMGNKVSIGSITPDPDFGGFSDDLKKNRHDRDLLQFPTLQEPFTEGVVTGRAPGLKKQ
ncbi:unnamed protein product [Spirodela intermedia]|uniref:S-acyltransferase n=1 Tax=Spirodela intermedia TaxID=51605 RepID=A0A7I8IA36_SPIIN|nr:unnamed protein product [Spirodela intermedia]CAA6654450.1 unnamed protein product [Spirodela intermedia]